MKKVLLCGVCLLLLVLAGCGVEYRAEEGFSDRVILHPPENAQVEVIPVERLGRAFGETALPWADPHAEVRSCNLYFVEDRLAEARWMATREGFVTALVSLTVGGLPEGREEFSPTCTVRDTPVDARVISLPRQFLGDPKLPEDWREQMKWYLVEFVREQPGLEPLGIRVITQWKGDSGYPEEDCQALADRIVEECLRPGREIRLDRALEP